MTAKNPPKTLFLDKNEGRLANGNYLGFIIALIFSFCQC
jgi:hypothetical protein